MVFSAQHLACQYTAFAIQMDSAKKRWFLFSFINIAVGAVVIPSVCVCVQNIPSGRPIFLFSQYVLSCISVSDAE